MQKEWHCPDCGCDFTGNDGEPCPSCDNGDVEQVVFPGDEMP